MATILGRASTRWREERWRRAFGAQVRRDVTSLPPAAFARFGKGSVILPPARVTCPDRISIGRDVVVLEGAWLSVVQANSDAAPTLELGDRVRLGRGCTIACIGEVVIENDVEACDSVFMGDCYHDYQDPYRPVIHQAASTPAAVHIGAGAYLGTGAIVLRGVRIGRGAYVGEGSVVTGDVPDHAVVFGNPAVIAYRPARES
jgi:acetyltransferase-like isoleucine patch superfamily enzyme